jgi:RNA polymerase sigma-70 factor (ECF subfamily)
MLTARMHCYQQLLVLEDVTIPEPKRAAPVTLDERIAEYFEGFRMHVFRFLLRRTHDASQAEDLTQETFLRLCVHLREERPLENPRAWLFTVAANLSIDISRHQSNITDLDEPTWEKIENSRSGLQSNPEALLLQNERLDRVQSAMLTLTPLQRECLHLRDEGLLYREMADLLGISISTIADALRRATVKLARVFDPQGPHERKNNAALVFGLMTSSRRGRTSLGDAA